MHDGSLKTLEDVVVFYNKGGTPNQWLSKDIRPLNLTPAEQKDLVAFMERLPAKSRRKYQPRRNYQSNEPENWRWCSLSVHVDRRSLPSDWCST